MTYHVRGRRERSETLPRWGEGLNLIKQQLLGTFLGVVSVKLEKARWQKVEEGNVRNYLVQSSRNRGRFCESESIGVLKGRKTRACLNVERKLRQVGD